MEPLGWSASGRVFRDAALTVRPRGELEPRQRTVGEAFMGGRPMGPPMPDGDAAGPRSPGTDLAPGIRLLEAEAPFPSANALLLEGEETVLVDAGLAPERLRALAPDLDRAVATHFHLDHTQGLPHLEGVPLVVNGAEEAVFRGGSGEVADFLGLDHPWRDRFAGEFEGAFPPIPDDAGGFEPGETLDLAGVRWETIPVPGHSPGHAMLHAPAHGILFSVDVDFRGWGPWYGWPHCDPTAFQEAVREHRELFREADVVATSHSPPAEGGEEALERADAFADAFDDRDRALEAFLEERGPEGATLPELVEGVRIFYGEHLASRPWHEFWCRTMTEMHLDRLADRGRVRRDGSVWRLAETAEAGHGGGT